MRHPTAPATTATTPTIATASLISSFPVEVLQSIFIYLRDIAVQPVDDGTPKHKETCCCRVSPIISSVCRRWRNCLFSLKEFWALIPLCNAKLTYLYLWRSKPLPIRLSVSARCLVLDPTTKPLIISNLGRVLDLNVHHTSGIDWTLTIDIVMMLLTPLPTYSHQLQWVNLSYCEGSRSVGGSFLRLGTSQKPSPFVSNLPKLAYLRLSQVSCFVFANIVAPNLTTLALINSSVWNSFDDCLSTLATLGNLRELRLVTDNGTQFRGWNGGAFTTASPKASVSLPNLTNLVLRDNIRAVVAIFDCLLITDNAKIELHSNEEGWPELPQYSLLESIGIPDILDALIQRLHSHYARCSEAGWQFDKVIAGYTANGRYSNAVLRFRAELLRKSTGGEVDSNKTLLDIQMVVRDRGQFTSAYGRSVDLVLESLLSFVREGSSPVFHSPRSLRLDFREGNTNFRRDSKWDTMRGCHSVVEHVEQLEVVNLHSLTPCLQLLSSTRDDNSVSLPNLRSISFSGVDMSLLPHSLYMPEIYKTVPALLSRRAGQLQQFNIEGCIVSAEAVDEFRRLMGAGVEVIWDGCTQ